MPSSRRSASCSPSTASPRRFRLSLAPLSRIFAIAGPSFSGRASTTRWPTISRSTRRAIGTTGDGRTGRDDSPDLDRSAQVPRQEPGHERGDPAQIGCRGGQALGPHHPIDEPDRERESVGVFQHAGESLGCGVHVDLCALGDPPLRKLHGTRCEIVAGCCEVGVSPGRVGHHDTSLIARAGCRRTPHTPLAPDSGGGVGGGAGERVRLGRSRMRAGRCGRCRSRREPRRGRRGPRRRHGRHHGHRERRRGCPARGGDHLRRRS